jgi:hypothetical protein
MEREREGEEEGGGGVLTGSRYKANATKISKGTSTEKILAVVCAPDENIS